MRLAGRAGTRTVRLAALLLAAAPAGAAATWRVADGRLQFVAATPQGERVLIRDLRYVGYAADPQPVIETADYAAGADGVIQVAVRPATSSIRVELRAEPLERGCRLVWRVLGAPADTAWDQGRSGFRVTWGEGVTGARSQPVTAWVEPDGDPAWEVAGDTPYPDTEFLCRQIRFADQALAVVTAAYDPDWYYGRNLDRTRIIRGALAESPVALTLLASAPDDFDPLRLAAEAAGRPVSLAVTTNRPGNLHEPGEVARLRCRVVNPTARPQAAPLAVDVWDYDGQRRLELRQEVTVPALGEVTVDRSVPTRERGLLFVNARLAWPGGHQTVRTTIGVLPQRRATGTLPRSPFGMASLVAAPERYPEQADLAAVLPCYERVGVRWVRRGLYPLREDHDQAGDERLRADLALFRQHGLLIHSQLGSGAPQPEEAESFRNRLEQTLGRYAWACTSVGIGNELNLGGLTGQQYVETMLRPIHDATRRLQPATDLFSMGLGGVHARWLAEFVAAGGMDLLDVLSIHPGCHPRAPEFWEGWRGWVFRSQVQDAVAAAQAHGKRVWITEAYAPAMPAKQHLDLRTAADYLVRTHVCALAAGVEAVLWYTMQDGVWFAQRPRPDDGEYSFGIVYTDLTPKPAYVAYGAMTEQLEGARCVGRLDLGADDLYAVRFERGGEFVDVCWSYRERHETDTAVNELPEAARPQHYRRPGEPWQERWRNPVEVRLPAAGPVTVTDLMGHPQPAPVTDGQVSLRLSGSPIYVRGLGNVPVKARFWEPLPQP